MDADEDISSTSLDDYLLASEIVNEGTHKELNNEEERISNIVKTVLNSEHVKNLTETAVEKAIEKNTQTAIQKFGAFLSQFTKRLEDVEERLKVLENQQKETQTANTTEIERIKTEIGMLKTDKGKQYDTELRKSNQELKSQNKELEIRIDNIDQKSRLDNLLFWGIEDHENIHSFAEEGAIDIIENHLDYKLNNDDENDRLTGIMPLTKTINGRKMYGVKVTLNSNLRQNLWSLKRNLKGKNIFMAEDLTIRNSKLFYIARQMVKSGRYKKAWTDQTRIFVEVNENEEAIKFTEKMSEEAEKEITREI